MKMFILIFLITYEICGLMGFPNGGIPDLIEGLKESVLPNLPPIIILQDNSSDDLNISIIQKCEPLNNESNDYKLEIRGIVIKFSDIEEETICKGKVKYLEIFALDEIVIDEDLVRLGQSMQVVAFAPRIKISGTRLINLSGAIGKEWTPSQALNGQMGINGKSGFAGYPGGPGGTFFALANEIENVDSLLVNVQGGNGGNGQNGGDGGNGIRGKLPTDESFLNIDSLLSMEDNLEICKSVVKKCIIRGEIGSAGGDAGHGGAGGKGGKAGQIFLYQLNQTNQNRKRLLASDGEQGLAGSGGKGGKGGQHGGYIEMTCCEEPRKIFKQAIGSIKSINTFAPSGKNGTDGINFQSLVEPEVLPVYREFPLVVNDYKKFLLSHLTDPIRKNKLLVFYNQITKSEEINKQYKTLSLLDELLGMEELFLNLTTLENLNTLYENLTERIHNYRESSVEIKSSDEYNALLFVDKIATNTVNTLSEIKKHKLVINVQELLNNIQENLNRLPNKLTQIDNNQLNKDQLQTKIKQTSKFIETDIKSDLLQLEDTIQRMSFQIVANIKSENTVSMVELSYAHFLLGVMRNVAKVMTTLASFALISLTSVKNPTNTNLQTLELRNNIQMAFDILDSYKVHKLHIVLVENKKSRTGGLSTYQEEFYSILIPVLEKIKKQFPVHELSSLGDNLPLFNVSDFRVQQFFTDLKHFLQNYVQVNLKNVKFTKVLVNNVDESIKSLEDIYNQMEAYEQEQRMTNFDTFYHGNRKLQETIDRIKMVNQANGALLQYQILYDAFQQSALPNSASYLYTIDNVNLNDIAKVKTNYENLFNTIKNNVAKLWKKLY